MRGQMPETTRGEDQQHVSTPRPRVQSSKVSAPSPCAESPHSFGTREHEGWLQSPRNGADPPAPHDVVRSLPCSPCGLAGRRLPRMQEVVGLNPTEGKICFHALFYLKLKVKNCFVIKLFTLLFDLLIFSIVMTIDISLSIRCLLLITRQCN